MSDTVNRTLNQLHTLCGAMIIITIMIITSRHGDSSDLTGAAVAA